MVVVVMEQKNQLGLLSMRRKDKVCTMQNVEGNFSCYVRSSLSMALSFCRFLGNISTISTITWFTRAFLLWGDCFQSPEESEELC